MIHFSCFHNIHLNSVRLLIILMLSGMSFKIVAAVYCKECKAYLLCGSVIYWYFQSKIYPLNIYGVTFNLKNKSFIYGEGGGLNYAEF